MKAKIFMTRLGLLALAAIGLLVSGCATPALWKQTAARVWRPDGTPDHLLMTSTTGRLDVIVVFRQSTTVGNKPKQRIVAWKPGDSPEQLLVGRSDVRRFTNACERVQLVPVFAREQVPADARTTPPGYAAAENWCQFSLHVDGFPSGPFDLPVTNVKCRRWARVAGMPLAIGADAAIVGTVLAAGACAGAGQFNVSR